MQIIELYINNIKVDLFEDESVSITDSIQNVKDISKVFTAYSQQFNLPASKTNNKLFKHYYNFDINNSFDARYKADAEIKLNGVNYKKGKIRLNEVSLKNNAPYSYKVVFFGDTIELKDLLAEDLLSSLSIPQSLDFEYTASNIYSKLTSTSISDSVIVPLITHSKRFEIANDSLLKSIIDNSLLDFTDLKPALRVREIIEAIERDYDIEFSPDFLNSYQFYQLYLWLHRNEGYISNSTEGGGVNSLTNRFYLSDTPSPSWNYVSGSGDQRPLSDNFEQTRYTGSLFVDVGVNTDEYTVLIIASDGNVLAQTTTTGDSTTEFQLYGNNYAVIDFNVTIQSQNTFSISQELTIGIESFESDPVDGDWWYPVGSSVYEADTNDITNDFKISQNMPKMKIFDFLMNLFKMFNLTVYKEDGIIKVEPLPDFYNAGKRYDITEYVDMSQSSVSKLLQFKNIDFRYKSKKTQLVKLSDELQGVEFSQEGYGNSEWDGGDYRVEVDFEKMMYERLSDTHQNPPVLTPITQGTFLDEKGEPTIGQPLLFYPINTNPSGYIKWKPDNSILTNYKRPSQVPGSGNIVSLNFGLEMDEHQREVVGSNLYEEYYNDYVFSLFDRRGRTVKVSAYLPLHIILNYKLNDRFVISGKSYKINTIKTNLLTNKSDLELITELLNINDLNNGISPYAPRVAQPTVSTKDASSITLSWDAVSGVAGYKLYVDNNQVDYIVGTFYKFPSLESGITYKLGVQASYTNYDAPITNTIETTD